jgi:hypothetical protein
MSFELMASQKDTDCYVTANYLVTLREMTPTRDESRNPVEG